jgi:hypothetical protein
MPEKKKKKGPTEAESLVEFLGQIAMGGASGGKVMPEIEATTRKRFDTTFAGTPAALGVGKAGALEATGNPRAINPQTGRPKFGGLAEAIPMLQQHMDMMGPTDIVSLSEWIDRGPTVEIGVHNFKKSKGWIKKD